MNTRNTAEVLRAAADRIERCGHAKNYFHDVETGGYCATGAVFEELDCWLSVAGWSQLDGADMSNCDAIYFLWKAAGYPESGRPYSLQEEVAFWNNQPERTAEEVIATLRKAARLWEKAHPEADTDRPGRIRRTQEPELVLLPQGGVRYREPEPELELV